MDHVFDWDRIGLNELPWTFLFEVLFRTVIMFLIVLVGLRMTGKRGVRQLSIFEVVLIISLGSAAGDPMFYEDVGLLPPLLVVTTVVFLYRVVTYFTGLSKKFETFLEGKTQSLVEEGEFSTLKLKKESLAHDEFFSELRVRGVEHLGQVRRAYMEASGEISLFFYEDNQVRFGLPILPELYKARSEEVKKTGIFACSHCGNVEDLRPGNYSCEKCGHKKWVEAINCRRIS